MNIENEYYTPDPSEFHLGFEFEFLTGATTWKPFTLDNNRAERVFENLRCNPELFRVKSLDREDVESLEFSCKEPYIWQYTNGPYMLICDIHTSKQPFPKGTIEIKKGEDAVFYGKIKNKSELKKLMSQLGI